MRVVLSGTEAGGGDGQFIGAFSSPRLSHVRSRSIPVLPGGHRGEVHRIPHAALVLFVQVAVAHLPFLPLASYVLTLHSYVKIRVLSLAFTLFSVCVISAAGVRICFSF